MKKITSLLMAVLLLCTMLSVFAVPASAEDNEKDYLCLTSTGSTEINLIGAPYEQGYKLEYSMNGGSWQTTRSPMIRLNNGDNVRFRANGTKEYYKSGNIKFTMRGSGTVAASGSVMSLLDGDECFDGCFADLFYNCTPLTVAPKLPAKILAKECYSNMFNGCTSLAVAPELPAEILAERCYDGMFSRCSSLKIPPELPAETLAEGCYDGMFSNCSSLEIPPELPAKTLVKRCYRYMFEHCTSLAMIPTLHAETLAEECYRLMFYECTLLEISEEKPAAGRHYYTFSIPDTEDKINSFTAMFEGVPGMPRESICGKTFYCLHAEYVGGVCPLCNANCPHDTWTDHECADCHIKCTHDEWKDNECVNCHVKCTHEEWQGGECVRCHYACKHDAAVLCGVCGKELDSGNNAPTGSTLSEGNLAIIVGFAALVIGLGGGFFLGRKKKKTAEAE